MNITLHNIIEKILLYRWFSVFCITSAFALAALGTWQLERLKWKVTLIKQIEENIALEPITFPIIDKDTAQIEFRRIRLKGTFLYDNEIAVSAKYYKGKAGFHLITPFKLVRDNTLILVNRGWVESPDEKNILKPGGIVEINGFVRKGDRLFWFSPQNIPNKNQWYTIELPLLLQTIRDTLPEELIRPVLVQAYGKEDVSKRPILLSPNFTVRNDHLQYAITWYALALTTLIMYVIYMYKQKPNVEK